MVVKLELKSDVQAGLSAEAEARGLSLEAFLLQLVQDHVTMGPALSGKEWEKEFEEWINSFPDTPALSDEAISRESMYPDRW